MDNQLFTTIALLTLAFAATLSNGASVESNDCIIPLYLFEVCGENNITYSNPEHAGCEDVAVACDGACPCSPAQQQDLCKVRFYLYTVCGENNQTYDNPDLAKCDNVDVACDGSCPCSKPTPNTIDEPSTPCACAAILDPVCGKDGVEYPNACAAECDRMEVACEGSCPCPESASANLMKRTACVCAAIFQPVCGNDGNDYPNACAAGCEHVEVACEGSCPCSPMKDSFCACPFNYDPVCGSNGVGYPNSCAAGCDRVQVDCQGQCPCRPN